MRETEREGEGQRVSEMVAEGCGERREGGDDDIGLPPFLANFEIEIGKEEKGEFNVGNFMLRLLILTDCIRCK